MTPAIALATYAVLAAALFGLFWASSRRLDASSHGAIQRWLERLDEASDGVGDGASRDRQWAESFIRWFDQAFAVRTKTLPLIGEVPLPSFARSVLVSFLSLLVLALVWVANIPGMGRAGAHAEISQANWEMIERLVIVYGGATLITNWIPDYLSLIESRMIIARMARAERWSGRLAWLLVDAAATLAISFFAIHLGMVLLLPVVTPAMDIEVGCLTPQSYSLATTWELFVSGLRFEGPSGTLNYDATGIYIYSTFLTSLWVWIYLVGSFVLRVFVRFAPAAWTRAARRQPLQAMGLMVVLVFSAAYWPSWTDHRAHSADVYVHHVAHDREAAQALARELDAAGLRVRTSAQVGPALARELLREADGVIVLDSLASAGELDADLHELAVMAECGERVSGASLHVRVPDPTDAAPDLYAYPGRFWDGYGDSEAIVSWAQRVPTILGSSQIRECQALMPEHPPASAICDARPRR